MDSKLKCVFENPVTSTTTAKTTATSTTTKADANTINGKNKAVSEFVKSSPKVRNYYVYRIVMIMQINQLFAF